MQNLEQDIFSQFSDNRISESSHINYFEQKTHVAKQELNMKKE